MSLMRLLLLAIFSTLLPWSARADAVSPSIQLKQNAATVLIFISVDCPISNGYMPEVNRIIDRNSPAGVQFMAVYADADTTPEQAAAHAKAYDIHCRTLIDGDHSWMKRTGVTVTPEAAVLSADGKLLYAGRIDNRYTDFGKKRFAATTHDLQDVIDAVVQHRSVPAAQLPLVGCPIP